MGEPLDRVEKLRDDVRNCRVCDGLGFPFGRPAPDRPFFRFPPTIGATGPAPLLFVGVNPRLSDSNRDLHDRLASSRAAFNRLSRNRLGARRYVATDGPEPHYRAHVRLAEAVFPGTAFEEVAAVTELFLCASSNATGLRVKDSPCAERFLGRVIQQARPEVIIAVGKMVERYFETRVRRRLGLLPVVGIGGHEVAVVVLPHPNARGEKAAGTAWAISATRAVLRGEVPPPQPAGGLSAGPSHVPDDEGVLIARDVRWSDRYGWRPRHTAADLRALEVHAGSKIWHRLLDGDRLVYMLEMTAEELREALGSYVDGPTWERNGYITRITKTRGGKPTREFIERWAACVRAPI